ncbi:MAG: orotate phosphoribosyltransferase [Chlamydiota bacterium]|nr:orotate phosphoribosyltransferase [Chlamydiota bacterium]
MNIRDIILRLYDIEAVKFGNFTLKSGIESPFYIDLRLIPSYPLLLKAVSEAMWSKIQFTDFELICGVPYTAMPIATVISMEHNVPMIMRRKEVKNYGTKKAVEGAYKTGQRCALIEDLITSGASIIETIEPLKSEGVIVKDVVVLIDRQQGGTENLQARKVSVHSVMTISDILATLLAAERIEPYDVLRVQEFLNQNQKVSVV